MIVSAGSTITLVASQPPAEAHLQQSPLRRRPRHGEEGGGGGDLEEGDRRAGVRRLALIEQPRPARARRSARPRGGCARGTGRDAARCRRGRAPAEPPARRGSSPGSSPCRWCRRYGSPAAIAAADRPAPRESGLDPVQGSGRSILGCSDISRSRMTSDCVTARVPVTPSRRRDAADTSALAGRGLIRACSGRALAGRSAAATEPVEAERARLALQTRRARLAAGRSPSRRHGTASRRGRGGFGPAWGGRSRLGSGAGRSPSPPAAGRSASVRSRSTRRARRAGGSRGPACRGRAGTRPAGTPRAASLVSSAR